MKPSHRRKARKLAVQAMYQLSIAGGEPAEVVKEFLADAAPSVDAEYFTQLIKQGYGEREAADAVIMQYADRGISEMTPIERNLLRMAYYELVGQKLVPARVIIHEALELNKMFGTEEGFKFVNAVLDKMAKVLRKEELACQPIID